MNNGFQQMWAEIKNLWNHALIIEPSNMVSYITFSNMFKFEKNISQNATQTEQPSNI